MNYRLFSICCLCSIAIVFVTHDRFALEPIAPKNSEFKTSLKLSKQIEAIVVKIKASQKFGSGIIIQKRDRNYLVVTNRHVISGADNYQIQTSDNRVYGAKSLAVSLDDDLAILQFKSDRLYSVAAIDSTILRLYKPLLTAGFPFNSDRLQITSGQLLLKTHKPLKQGYQLGYTNVIHEGMSGGAIVNFAGEVVGINGRSANPIVPDYQYQDLSYPSKHLQQRMTRLSWGIPIIKAIELINEQ